MSGTQAVDHAGSFLAGVRVVEIADELGEYCGKVLAGLGADVIKVEPASGEVTRSYGPFYHDDPSPDRSLYFWHYNLGKRGVCLDLGTEHDVAQLRRLIGTADVLIDTRPRGHLAGHGLDWESLRVDNPGLVYARISPFGDDGPWADYRASDLVHLALGGVMMNCGYDPDPHDVYDTPPIAPQMWQAYHITGEMTALAIIAALTFRQSAGTGQYLATAVHEAVSMNTETDMPNWTFLRQINLRQTCLGSTPSLRNMRSIAMTKDGRWLLPYRTYLPGAYDPFNAELKMMIRYGMQADLEDLKYQDLSVRTDPIVAMHIRSVSDALIGRLKFDYDLWREAQQEQLPWAPLRIPHENLQDGHFGARQSFAEVHHPELGETFTYVGAKWFAPEVPWCAGPRAPLLGEHNDEVLDALPAATSASAAAPADGGVPGRPRMLSKLGKPFALEGVRIIDLSWMLASAGAGRYFTSLGAEVIKVEHRSKWDQMRWGKGAMPPGGRAQRDAASGPLPTPAKTDDPNTSGAFMEINAGKLGISLNLKHPRGKELLTELIRGADMVIEGFSPGTMRRMGFGYGRLQEINPRIIYVQQSGLGEHGSYGSVRTYGPSAAAFSGLSEMSGLPAPYPPAGIGYSYLDWFGAYNMALAMMAALHRQRATGLGCYIDSSQVETGIYLNGTAILDYTVNGRKWQRYGNASPFKPAAPHGAYPTSGEDRWIAIACFDEQQWHALADTLNIAGATSDPRYSDLPARLASADQLDAVVGQATRRWEPFELMRVLQERGVPAGVCQNAADRCEDDPQLAFLGWRTELEQADLGVWPVKGVPVKYSATPPYIGGLFDRSGPSYAQDNDYVYGKLLGLSESQLTELREQDVI